MTARMGRNKHGTKLVPLNVVDICMARKDCETTGYDTKIYPYCIYWLLGNPFSLDGYLLNLDILVRALDLPQSNMPYPL